jgi:hypothetical protein
MPSAPSRPSTIASPRSWAASVSVSRSRAAAASAFAPILAAARIVSVTGQ